MLRFARFKVAFSAVDFSHHGVLFSPNIFIYEPLSRCVYCECIFPNFPSSLMLLFTFCYQSLLLWLSPLCLFTVKYFLACLFGVHFKKSLPLFVFLVTFLFLLFVFSVTNLLYKSSTDFQVVPWMRGKIRSWFPSFIYRNKTFPMSRSVETTLVNSIIYIP